MNHQLNKAWLRAALLAVSFLVSATGSSDAEAQVAKTESSGSQQAPEESASAGVVNINTATAAELMRLPGVGEAKARAIIARRERNAFVRIENIMGVKGIGRASFRKLRPMLTVKGPTTLGAKP